MKKPILIFPALIMLLLAAENGREAYVAHSTARAYSDGIVAVVCLFGAACFSYIGIKGAKKQGSRTAAITNEDQRSSGNRVLWLVSSIVGAGVGIAVFLSWLFK